MNSTMITATNTLSQLQKQMDIISNNLANVDTNGFKSKQARFTDLLFSQLNNQPNASAEQNRLTPNGIRQGSGAKLGQILTDMKQGSLKSTGRELDTAFQTEGQYYKVLVQKDNSSSIQYTRDGAFYLTPVAKNEVMLVTSDGNPVLDEGNHPITITGDASKYTVNPNGSLDVTMTNGTKNSYNLGVIQVNKPQFFEQKGGNLIGLPDSVPAGSTNNIFTNLTGQQREKISIGQGMLENSNVDMAKEMTDLVSVQRAYQFQARSVTMSDQMMGLINGIR
ncbi:flagellar hook-basal body protein [Neobacillus sp. PS3-40]|uniref:flagellar hook-basal body protein n=1 Tax=Neobacillus sp. PS3-40 TaxID=3070679 RepID=UPI0027E02FEF|nr:flagellar hook-basal body protein [Neobacillus sp. PS3-40]WML46215.1 flagellar hook-basal body protein [Neobacillus sp. PS3-40]